MTMTFHLHQVCFDIHWTDLCLILLNTKKQSAHSTALVGHTRHLWCVDTASCGCVYRKAIRRSCCPPGTSSRPPQPPNRPPAGPGPEDEKPNNFKNYLIAGAFFIGMGTGVWFDSGASFTPSNVASTELVDRKTPNSEICMASGYSSMVFDQRLFVSFNP